MFWVFSKEKRELRELMTLAELTISRMEIMLSEPINLVNKRQIDDYLQRRREDSDKYTRLYNGHGDEFDVVFNTVRNGWAGTARDAMSNELQYFMGSVEEFCQYLTKITLPPVNNLLSPSPAYNSDGRQTLRAADRSDEDIDVIGVTEQTTEVRQALEIASRSKQSDSTPVLERAMFRAEISDLSVAVSDTLKMYVDVHNAILDHPWWRSLPIPGLFKPIDFDCNSSKIACIEEMLSGLLKQANSIHSKTVYNDNKYLAELLLYVEALIESVSALAIVVQSSKEKIEGRLSYSFRDYKSDVDKYRAAELKHLAIGKELNNEWRIYIDQNPAF